MDAWLAYRILSEVFLTNSAHEGSGAKRKSDLYVIKIPTQFDQVRGSIICAKLRTIQCNRHFSAVLCLYTVDHSMYVLNWTRPPARPVVPSTLCCAFGLYLCLTTSQLQSRLTPTSLTLPQLFPAHALLPKKNVVSPPAETPRLGPGTLCLLGRPERKAS